MNEVVSIEAYLDSRNLKLVSTIEEYISKAESSIRDVQAILRRLNLVEGNLNVSGYGGKFREIRDIGETRIELSRDRINVAKSYLARGQTQKQNSGEENK